MAKKDAEKQEEVLDPRKTALRNGGWIFLMLGVLTFGEFLVGSIAPNWRVIFWIVAIWKAIYVMKDYMHIGRLFVEEEGN